MSTPSLLLPAAQTRRLREQAKHLPKLALQAHELAALELLLRGALAPLDGFNTKASTSRPLLPLDVSGLDLDIGAQLALQDNEGVTLAVIRIDQLHRDQSVVTAGGAVRGLAAPEHELFAHYRTDIAVLRSALASADKAASLCVHVRGDFDEESCARIDACAKEKSLLLRILDVGDPDRAHQLKRTLSDAENLRAQLGAKRCAIVVSPDPWPSQGDTQQSLDECFAQNLGCKASIWMHSAPQRLPPLAQPGCCIFFTGLSGSGKSTLARALHAHIVHNTARAVSLLDGDVVRRHLSKGLGFARADRDLNVLRIGFVASRIVMHGGVVICAPIAPYAAARAQVRDMIERYGRFVEVHVSTALAVCEARDRKGLYAQARAGQIKEFTGISDPYEAPEHAEFTIDTDLSSIDDAVAQIASAFS